MKSDKSSKWYKNISIPIVFSSLLILFGYSYYLPLLDHIDSVDLICDSIVSAIILFLIHIISKENNRYPGISILIVGFSFLYISLFSDVMDEIFYVPIIIKNLLENLPHVIAYLTIGYGVYKWLSYNRNIQNKLQILSSTDTLTGILNRRSFLKKADIEFERSKRYKEDLSLIMIDVDHFKKINDSYGHSIGDEVLVNISNNISNRLRKNDLFCRWGGEEFLLLLPKVDTEAITVVSEKIRQCILNQPIKLKDGTILQLTVSMGCTSFKNEDKTLDAVIERADTSMYLSKDNGRNRVTFL